MKYLQGIWELGTSEAKQDFNALVARLKLSTNKSTIIKVKAYINMGIREDLTGFVVYVGEHKAKNPGKSDKTLWKVIWGLLDIKTGVLSGCDRVIVGKIENCEALCEYWKGKCDWKKVGDVLAKYAPKKISSLLDKREVSKNTETVSYLESL